jgi:hypothetical protein
VNHDRQLDTKTTGGKRADHRQSGSSRRRLEQRKGDFPTGHCTLVIRSQPYCSVRCSCRKIAVCEASPHEYPL